MDVLRAGFKYLYKNVWFDVSRLAHDFKKGVYFLGKETFGERNSNLPIVLFDISAPLTRAASFLLPESSCTFCSPCLTGFVSKLRCITELLARKKKD